MLASQFFVDRNPVLNVGSRTVLALAGAYGVALVGAAALSVGLPLVRLDSALIALMMGFIIQLLGVLWVFAAATVLDAFVGLLVPACLFAIWFVLAGGGA
jgi:hypothetical protein